MSRNVFHAFIIVIIPYIYSLFPSNDGKQASERTGERTIWQAIVWIESWILKRFSKNSRSQILYCFTIKMRTKTEMVSKWFGLSKNKEEEEGE